MKEYKCDICNKVFKYKNDYTRHINKKNPCKIRTQNEPIKSQNEPSEKDTVFAKNEQLNMLDIDNNKNQCKYCNKLFSSNSHYNRHMNNNCKKRKEIEKEKENIFQRLLGELEEMRKMNDKIVKSNEEIKKANDEIKEKNRKLECELKKITNKKIKNINKTQNNIINNGNIISGNTFMLIGYGKEDMTKIDKNDIIRSLKGFNTPLKLTEAVHFNSKYPEYHNVYISNMKDKYAMIYEGKQWSLITKTELIDKLYDDKKSYIEDNFEEFCEKLTHSQRRAMDRWLNIDDEDPKVKAIKEDIKLLLYNKRDIPMQTKELNVITEN